MYFCSFEYGKSPLSVVSLSLESRCFHAGRREIELVLVLCCPWAAAAGSERVSNIPPSLPHTLHNVRFVSAGDRVLYCVFAKPCNAGGATHKRRKSEFVKLWKKGLPACCRLALQWERKGLKGNWNRYDVGWRQFCSADLSRCLSITV